VSPSRELDARSPALVALVIAGLGGLTLSACSPANGDTVRISAVRTSPGSGEATLVELRYGTPADAEAERASACVALAEQAEARGASLADRAARLAGIARKDASGRAEWDGTRVAPRMSEAAFARIAALHERGHCEDGTMPAPSAIVSLPASDREWSIHRWEVFADAWAALAALRDGTSPEAVKEWADLRAVGVLMNGIRRNGGDAWARYHTAPAIDAALAWSAESGAAAVSGLSDDQIGRVARWLTEGHALDRSMYAALAAEVPRIRLDDGRAVFPSGLPSGFRERLELALARSGIAPRPSDRLSPGAR